MLFCAFVPFSFFFSCALSFVFFLIRLLVDFFVLDTCTVKMHVLRPMLMITISYSSEMQQWRMFYGLC